MKILEAPGKKSLSAEELLKKARLKKSDKKHLADALFSLTANGLVLTRRGGKFASAKALGFFPGVVTRVNGNYGFAQKDGEQSELFVPGRALLGAMPGDAVLLKSIPSRGSLPEGEVIKIVREGSSGFTGVFAKENGVPCVYPDRLMRFPVKVAKGQTAGAEEGDKVQATLVKRGASHFDHTCRVERIFGNSESAAACARAILAENAVPLEFTPPALSQAAAIAKAGVDKNEFQGRADLRDLPIFTIDSADTKDIDDAVSLEKTGDVWRLGVHIADVSHYVAASSPLDDDAFYRGTSVYYANSVVPMLPKELSNGICSLNPNEDRLAFSCFMELTPKGKMTAYRFGKSVIRSRVKGVYKEINAILDKTADEGILQKYAEVAPCLPQMQELAGILTRNRFNRGGLNLETSESKIIVDEKGEAVDIQPRERGESEKMIEEFMLSANEAAATYALSAQIPFVYRIHEEPSSEKIEALHDTLTALGYNAGKINLDLQPHDLAVILNKARGTPTERIVSTHILRSMAKAKYSAENKGHFGLVLKNYAHFTSPIRRYPDLAIHRILTDLVKGESSEKIAKKYAEFAKDASEQSSRRELAAMAC